MIGRRRCIVGRATAACARRPLIRWRLCIRTKVTLVSLVEYDSLPYLTDRTVPLVERHTRHQHTFAGRAAAHESLTVNLR